MFIAMRGHKWRWVAPFIAYFGFGFVIALLFKIFSGYPYFLVK
jgi:hypothetical protein